MQHLRDLDIEPADEDYGPQLEWESPLWRLYCQMQRQWRVGFNGLIGIDYTVFLPVISDNGWNMDVCLELLSAIESEVLDSDD